MATCTQSVAIRSDDYHVVAGGTQPRGENLDAGSVDTVIVADQNAH